MFSSQVVLFKRTIRVLDANGKMVREVPLALSVRHQGVLDPRVSYRVPGFADAAQVRKVVTVVGKGDNEVQLKVFKTTELEFKKLLVSLRKLGWRVVKADPTETPEE